MLPAPIGHWLRHRAGHQHSLKADRAGRFYTLKDFELNRLMLDIGALADAGARAAA